MSTKIVKMQHFVATLSESFSRDTQVYKPSDDSPLPAEYYSEDNDLYDKADILAEICNDDDLHWIDTDRPIYLGMVSALTKEKALANMAKATGFREEQIELSSFDEYLQYCEQ